MASVIPWLDVSADEQRRMRELAAMFTQRDSRDERHQPVGFGAVSRASQREDSSDRTPQWIVRAGLLARRRIDPLVSDTSGKIRFNLLQGARMPEPWLSADDIADYLGVTKDTIYAWIADKGMPAHKVGRLWKFQTSEVDEWVRRGDAASAD